jgi:broad specificity phosphatase PhoE
MVYLVQHAERQGVPGDPGLTDAGREQALRTGRWLHGRGVQALWASPMRRARETADRIAAVIGLPVSVDARLAERLNWDGSLPYDEFLALWARTRQDRYFVPAGGESSRQAGERLQAFLADLEGEPGPVAAVTHGGVTVDLLLNLLGDDAVPPHLLDTGIPPCAVTALDGPHPVVIASVIS